MLNDVPGRAAVFDSYACRKGKGRLSAVERAQGYARSHPWFLTMDIRKYFESIHQATLREMLGRKFKDPLLLGVFDRILASYQTAPGRGLPIGNLTSQHFANFYLSPLDRFLKETLGREAFVRYMDDFVVWGESGGELREVLEPVRVFLAAELKLDLKSNTAINRTAFGMDFLGYRLCPGTVRLARRSKVRFVRKFRRYEAAHRRGRWSELVLQQRMQALLAFVMAAESGAFRGISCNALGWLPNGSNRVNRGGSWNNNPTNENTLVPAGTVTLDGCCVITGTGGLAGANFQLKTKRPDESGPARHHTARTAEDLH